MFAVPKITICTWAWSHSAHVILDHLQFLLQWNPRDHEQQQQKKKIGASYYVLSTNMLLQRRVTGPSELLDWVFKDTLYLASLLTNHVEIKVMNFS